MRCSFERRLDKRNALKTSEEAGLVADSLEIRKALMDRVYSGEITLIDAQKELKKIKSGAKKKGLMTRSQAWSRG
jgi:hypothetical protein